jgi:hypothetical protein
MRNYKTGRNLQNNLTLLINFFIFFCKFKMIFISIRMLSCHRNVHNKFVFNSLSERREMTTDRKLSVFRFRFKFRFRSITRDESPKNGTQPKNVLHWSSVC